jgi:hypothetical protein
MKSPSMNVMSGIDSTPPWERQRRSGRKPRVAATRLPWVHRAAIRQPHRGCGASTPTRFAVRLHQNPDGVHDLFDTKSQGSALGATLRVSEKTQVFSPAFFGGQKESVTVETRCFNFQSGGLGA